MAAEKLLVDHDLRPAYYDAFQCLAADCRISCCNGWRISFDKKDYLALKRQEGSPELNQRMENALRRIRKGPLSNIHYGEFVLGPNGCPLLSETGLCMLQLEKGHEALPLVCRIFPRIETYLPSGYLERSLSPACEGVLALLWDLPEGVDFASDPLPKEKCRSYIPKTENVLVRCFAEIREACVDLLQDRRFPLPQRILHVGFVLKELAEGEQNIPRWLARVKLLGEEGGAPLTFEDEDQTLSMFLSGNIRILLGDVLADGINAMKRDVALGLGVEMQIAGQETNIRVDRDKYRAACARFQERFGDRDYFMENLMVSLFFHLHIPDVGSPEELWKSYVNFCNVYSFFRFMAVMSCREEGAGDREELFRMLVYASRTLLHNGANQATLRDEFFQHNSATLAHMAVLLSG